MGGRGFKMYGKVVWPGFSDAPPPRRVARVGRNEPCPCGSGRKYKECHEKDGEAFLEKIAREQDRQRVRQRRTRLKEAEGNAPWYRRLFSREH